MINEIPCKTIHSIFTFDCKKCWEATQLAHSEYKEKERRDLEYKTFHNSFCFPAKYCDHDDCGAGSPRHAFQEYVDPDDPRLKYGYKPKQFYLCCEHYRDATGDHYGCQTITWKP